MLLDAPCSSTGTIRRHPDVPWLKAPADIAKLAGLQRRLIERAVALTKPGGTLVYCTCSLEPEEGEDVVAGLLAREPDVRRAPIAAVRGFRLRASSFTADGDLRTLPCHFPDPNSRLAGLDGFYAARLVKTLAFAAKTGAGWPPLRHSVMVRTGGRDGASAEEGRTRRWRALQSRTVRS